MNQRIKNFVSLLRENRLNAYLVTKDVNILYLTGFPSSDSWLLVVCKENSVGRLKRSFSRRGTGPRVPSYQEKVSIHYVTDFRYLREAKKAFEGQGIIVTCFKKTLAETIFALMAQYKATTLGFDGEHISLSEFKRLKVAANPGVRLIACSGLIESLRQIKEDAEINTIRRAIALNLEAYQVIPQILKSGLTEKEILLKLEQFVRSKNAGFSFPPIIASGVNSSFPHAKVTDRKLKKGEPLLIDMGIEIEGYKSDLTRMFFLGKIPHRFKEMSALVRTAQEKAIRRIKAGVIASEVDREARNFLKGNRLDKFFGHSLGHGVGLEIHERPRLSENNHSILKERMVVTIEPAVYLPNEFGIRMEDMVLVTPNGCEVLSGNRDH